MSDFLTFKFDKPTGLRFREFAPQFATSHSEAISKLLDFYLKAQLAPDQKKKGLQILIDHIDKRMDGNIAIIKKIEKEKIDHIHGMLKSLFGLASPQEKPIAQAKSSDSRKNDPFDEQYKDAFEVIELNHQKKTLQWEIKEVKKEFFKFLDQKVEEVHPAFGNPFLKVKLSRKEFEALKQLYNIE